MSWLTSPQAFRLLLLLLRWSWVLIKWFAVIYIGFLIGPFVILFAAAMFANR